MTVRIALPVLCFSVCLWAANAQTTQPNPPAKPGQSQPEANKPDAAKPDAPKPDAAKPDAAKPDAGKPDADKPDAPKPDAAKPPVRETPPDMKALTDAMKIADPEKKIEALEKFKRDFHDSPSVASANTQILSTLLHKFPDQTERVRTFAAGMYRQAEPARRGAEASSIATQFLNADVLLKDAERYARKSLDSMRLAAYISEQMASYEKRKQKPPAPEELQKRFLESRSLRVATLGRIEVKLGHLDKGRQMLEQAYAQLPKNTTVAAALGVLAAKAGQDAKAMDLLLPEMLSGSPDKDPKEAFDTVYRKTHAGSLDGMEAMLDAESHKRFPNPLSLDPFKPTEKRTDRVVLAEVFTGSGCPPCVGADLAFDAAMERYSRKDLAVVMYHLHIPRPDPMSNLDTQARAKIYEVNGVPSYVIDGKKTVGGGPRDNTKQVFDRFRKDLETELETPADAYLHAEASLAGNTVKVQASVDGVKSESPDLKLQILLLEKEVHYAGENGIRFHPMVVRAMGGDKAEGFPVDAQAGGSFEHSFDLDAVTKALKAHLDDYEAKGHRGDSFKFREKKDRIDRANLAVVVFVQDDKTKHLLQAAYIDLGQPAPTRPPTEANGQR